jgi:hypothetical protein
MSEDSGILESMSRNTIQLTPVCLSLRDRAVYDFCIERIPIPAAIVTVRSLSSMSHIAAVTGHTGKTDVYMAK